MTPTTADERYARERTLHDRMDVALAAARTDVEILDVELDDVAQVARVYIDRVPVGDPVDTELCGAVTQLVHDECADLGIEVSSPGFRRPLRRLRHFEQAAGQPVKVRLLGNKRPVNAVVEGIADDDAVLLRRTGSDGAERTPLDTVVRCHVEPTEPLVIPKTSSQPRERKGRA